MNIIRNRTTVKNSRKDEYDMPQQLDLLNRWTIPKIEPRVIYQMGTFEKLGFKQIVKTTEETITVDSDHGTFRLLSENDFAPYRDNYKFMHIGLVQVAFKPLTLRGLPESFIAALRDGRNLNWKKSLIGTVQTSLAYGPVYFNISSHWLAVIRTTNLSIWNQMLHPESLQCNYRIFYEIEQS